jgi:GMP synthase (glutamine-hydrolysing)
MKILCIQHAPFEGPGAIKQWALNSGHKLTEVGPYANETLPASNEFDLIIIMGGPQSLNNIKSAPYLSTEVNYIREAIKQNKMILGICLGAQIIAVALGGNVVKSPEKEIGAHPIELTDSAKTDPVFSQLENGFNAIHWHSEMVEIPKECVLLSRSKGCSNQAFKYGDRVYALQFHLELTHQMIVEMIQHCSDDLTKGKFIQTTDQLKSIDCDRINLNLLPFLRFFESLNYDQKLFPHHS